MNATVKIIFTLNTHLKNFIEIFNPFDPVPDFLPDHQQLLNGVQKAPR